MTGQLRIAGGRKLKSPKGISTRPTTARVREAVMNLVSRKVKGSNWLDLFSGSGVMGCEALQKGAKRILAVEHDPKTAKICQSNLLLIAKNQEEKKHANVFCQEVIQFLDAGFKSQKTAKVLNQKFDIVYLDPPYEAKIYAETLDKLLQGSWIKKDSLVICEYSSSNQLAMPNSWIEKDRRTYGGTSLLLISPKSTHYDDTGSKQPQTDLKALQELSPRQFQEEGVQSFTRTPGNY